MAINTAFDPVFDIRDRAGRLRRIAGLPVDLLAEVSGKKPPANPERFRELPSLKNSTFDYAVSRDLID
jgi:hypothetical protein